MLNTIKEFLSGKKTYLVAAGLIIGAVTAWASGEASFIEMVVAVLNGLGLSALRSGVKKAE